MIIYVLSLRKRQDKREWLSGGASPCQGEGRGFESRLALSLLHKKASVWMLFLCNRGTSVPRRFEVSAHIKWAPVRAVPRSTGPRAPSRVLCPYHNCKLPILFSCTDTHIRASKIRGLRILYYINFSTATATPSSSLDKVT